MEMDKNFKKNWAGVGEGEILSPQRVGWLPPPPYAADPMLIMHPLIKFEGKYDSMGSAAKYPLADPYSFF